MFPTLGCARGPEDETSPIWNQNAPPLLILYIGLLEMKFHFFKKLKNYYSTVTTAAFFRGSMTYSREAGLELRLTDSWSSAHSAQAGRSLR